MVPPRLHPVLDTCCMTVDSGRFSCLFARRTYYYSTQSHRLGCTESCPASDSQTAWSPILHDPHFAHLLWVHSNEFPRVYLPIRGPSLVPFNQEMTFRVSVPGGHSPPYRMKSLHRGSTRSPFCLGVSQSFGIEPTSSPSLGTRRP